MKNIRQKVSHLVLGAPVSSRHAKNGNMPKRRALPLFGADGISSVAYAPDEIILTLLIAGHSALAYSPLIGLGIAAILLIVIGTYRYNIQHVGEQGDFALVRKNLGITAAVLLGAAMMTDFILTVAVSLASATQYLESITPALMGHQRLIACALILMTTLLCLRGIRFMFRVAHIPVYLFLTLLAGVLITGITSAATGALGFAESASYTIHRQDNLTSLTTDLGIMTLLLRSFASGSVAIAGVNTISNAVKAFTPPRQRNAALTLFMMGGISATLLISTLYLAYRTQTVYTLNPATDLTINGTPAPADFHQTPILLQITDAIFTTDWATILLGASTIGILIIAAMSAFTGFPMLATTIAHHQYLPIHFSARSSASLYANGVLLLGTAATALVAIVGPNVHTLVQMYIVGVFTAMSLTQLAVLKNRWRAQRFTLNTQKRRTIWRDIAITAIGATASLAVLIVVIATKFTHGAWVSILLILALTFTMMKTKKYYTRIDSQLALGTTADELAADRALPSRVHALIYVERVRKPVLRALAYARASRPSSIEAVLVNADEARVAENVRIWNELELPVDLTVLDAPYRDPAATVMDYVQRMKQKSPRDVLVVYLPEYIVRYRWQQLFHRRTVHKLKARLRHEPGVVVASVPWQLDDPRETR